jgi:hypothetical protein
MNVIRAESSYTPRERAKRAEDPGRPTRRLAGGYIDDLAALHKAIALCLSCAPKFNAAHYGYATKRNLPFVRGQCDGCGQYSPQARLFLHHSEMRT